MALKTSERMCPLLQDDCIGKTCAFWCHWAKDCSVPLLAGMFADSEICRNTFEREDEQND